MTTVDLDLVRAMEERGFNSWPALRTIFFDGWVVRLSDGHTRRANSASPLWPSLLPPDALIEAIEALFLAADLRPIFRITPLADPAVDKRLYAHGWRDDDPSLGMFARDIIVEGQRRELFLNCKIYISLFQRSAAARLGMAAIVDMPLSGLAYERQVAGGASDQTAEGERVPKRPRKDAAGEHVLN